MLQLVDEHFVFYHIPKTGGTTLAAYIEQNFDQAESYFQGPLRPAARFVSSLTQREVCQIQKYRYFKGHFLFNLSSFLEKPVRTFTLLRSPGKRIVSEFFELRRIADATLLKSYERGRVSLKWIKEMRELRLKGPSEFLKEQGPLFRRYFWNIQAETVIRALAPRDRVVRDRLEQARLNLEGFDSVGILERFDQSLQLLCFTFGWRCPEKVQPLNQNLDASSAQEDPALAELLNGEFIREDQAVYEMAVKNFKERYAKMIATLARENGIEGRREAEIVAEPFLESNQKLIREWLDQRYLRRVYAGKKQHLFPRSAPKEVLISMAGPISGSGWLEREGLDHGGREKICRWSGPGLESTLDLRISPCCDHELKMRILEVLDPEIACEMKIFINGIEADVSVRHVFANSFDISCVISRSWIGDDGFCGLMFRVPKVISHLEFCGEPDPRLKGFRISALSVAPFLKAGRTAEFVGEDLGVATGAQS